MGEIIPLSDRASRDNGDVKGPSDYFEAKAILENLFRIPTFPGSESMACRYSKRRNLGDPFGVNRMLNYGIKKDNFKTSIILQKEVRLFHSSEENR